HVGGTVTLSIGSGFSGDLPGIDAALPGGRQLSVSLRDADDIPLAVQPHDPRDDLLLTGPLNAALIGQTTLRCSQPGLDRPDCRPSPGRATPIMEAVPAGQHQLRLP